MSQMAPRQRVMAALRRQQPDCVPKYADFGPAAYARFLEHTGQSGAALEVRPGRPGMAAGGEGPDPLDHFGSELRIVEFGDTRAQRDISGYLAGLPAGSRVDEWGIARVRSEASGEERMVHPLQNARHAGDIEAHPWPDVTAPYRRQAATEAIGALHERGLAAMLWPPINGGTFFEAAWRLRGFERFLSDMVEDQEIAEALLDRVGRPAVENARFAAISGADILLTGDDVGMQDRMLISPKMWRRWLKPRMAELIFAAKGINPHLLVFYHSDGFIEPIIPDLIEIGVDVLNPVQPECMDPVRLKRQFGRQISFWGTIGTQSTMPFGTPNEVRSLVRERIATVGTAGGLLLAPTHRLQPDVPWENIEAFFTAVEEFGRYA